MNNLISSKEIKNKVLLNNENIYALTSTVALEVCY